MKIVNRVKAFLVSVLRRAKMMTMIVVFFIAIGIISLAIFGGYVLFGQKYILAHFIVPGETVTVTKVVGDNMFTTWRGQSYADPRILVRKDNGWERSFPIATASVNLKPGDKLVMIRNGELKYLGEPLPIGLDVAMSQGEPANLPTETLAYEAVPIKKADAFKRKIIASVPEIVDERER